jgi:hypothetical protein
MLYAYKIQPYVLAHAGRPVIEEEEKKTQWKW